MPQFTHSVQWYIIYALFHNKESKLYVIDHFQKILNAVNKFECNQILFELADGLGININFQC